MHPEDSSSDSAESYVALVQQQIQLLNNELGVSQGVEVVVPMSNGAQVFVTRFGFENPNIIKVTGTDSNGHEICLIGHKNTFQVLLRKSQARPEVKPEIAFQSPAEPQDDVFNETA